MKSNNSKSVSKGRLQPDPGQSGFSLLELVIAMVIFIIISASIYGLLQIGNIDRNRASRRSDVLKNARVAIHMIGRDVLNAGLAYHRRGAVVPDNFNTTRFGVPADVDGNRDMLTGVLVGNDLFQNDLNLNTAVRTDMITFAYRDMDFNGGDTIELQGVAAVSGVPSTPRLTSKTATGAAAARPFDLYLVESDTSQIAIMATAVNGSNTIDAAVGDPLGINQALNGTGQAGSVLRLCTSSADQNCTTYSATAKRFFVVSYKVKQDGTLIRTIYGNNRGALASAQIQEMPLAYNVEDLQVKYVLEDGTTSDNPSVGVDGIVGTADDDWQGFNDVRQVMITIKVQSTESDEKTGRPDSITLNATFSTRNLGYDAS
ncbi:MAG: prepilin-type N-terminal cleavage/methylation domain-containing protein [Pyrinomonadaceae bacterium]|nr:prepilin-type N-terminal cleavage/methylation domain-containing protein [Pyrinomonadaceae bacterium]MBP6214260.1 prepilin-type N-terminal cleavage/methylation domain-containing protein [Pyrinomonadaceae bacterium]